MTTGFFITDSDDYFPDVDYLCNDMAGEDVDPKSSASAAAVPYVFFFLLDVLPQFLVLLLALHMLGSSSYMQLVLLSAIDMIGYGSYIQKLFTFSLLERMTCFISTILVMLYLVFLLINHLVNCSYFQQNHNKRPHISKYKQLITNSFLSVSSSPRNCKDIFIPKCFGD